MGFRHIIGRLRYKGEYIGVNENNLKPKPRPT